MVNNRNHLQNPPKKQNYCLKDSKGRIIETFHNWATAKQFKINLRPIYGNLSIESYTEVEYEKSNGIKGLNKQIKGFGGEKR